MKYRNTLFFSMLLSFHLFGQNIDQPKMEKDVEIAENILATLMKQAGNDQFVIVGRDRDVQGKYISDFGVVLSVSSSGLKVMYGKVYSDDKYAYSWSSGKDEEKAKEKAKEKGEEKDPSMALGGIFKEFLADYGNMIRQLTPTDKIMVKTENRVGNEGMLAMSMVKGKNISPGGVSAEVVKSDLIAHDNGKLTREELLDKIKITETKIDYSKEPQLEVFSSMLERLYEIDLSDTYYMARRPEYERVDKFGVTYYLKYYSSTVHDDDNYSLPTIAKKNVSKADRNKLVEEMYPKFLDGFKKNILDYGHILKNLDPSELIVFNIKLTSCEGCDMPASIELSTKKSVIEDYRKELISLDQAMTQIKVKDING